MWDARREQLPLRWLTRSRWVVEDMVVLRLERCHHGHQRFDEPGVVRAVRPKAALAPAHPGTNGPLRRVMRRFHSRMPHERPPRLVPLEERATHALGLGHTTRVPRVELPLHVLPDRPHKLAKLACASVPSRTRCHPWNIWRACACQASPRTGDWPPRTIMASIARNTCAPHRCRRHVGDQRSPLQRSVLNHPQQRSPSRAWATLPRRDRRTMKTVPQVVAAVPARPAGCPARPPVSSRYAAGCYGL